jgi:protein SCO1/2
MFSMCPGYRSLAQSQKPLPKKTVIYACPMHPGVTATKPIKCRKCGMTLRQTKTQTDSNATNSVPGRAQLEAGPFTAPKIPDVVITDQNGRRLHFYSDLVSGKVVAINFIFTTCTAICPLLTATFRRLQQELGDQVGRDVWLISVSVDPGVDTPERLHDFAAKFKAGPGWTFVTGDKRDIDSILQALGVGVGDKNDHTPLVLIGNDATGVWTRTHGLTNPTTMAKVITETAKK